VPQTKKGYELDSDRKFHNELLFSSKNNINNKKINFYTAML